MNGLHVLDNHRRNNRKITNFVLFMKRLRNAPLDAVHGQSSQDLEVLRNLPDPHMAWLWVDAFMNSFCLITCCVVLVFMFILEEGPKDLLLDALGLLFLQYPHKETSLLDSRWDDKF